MDASAVLQPWPTFRILISILHRLSPRTRQRNVCAPVGFGDALFGPSSGGEPLETIPPAARSAALRGIAPALCREAES